MLRYDKKKIALFLLLAVLVIVFIYKMVSVTHSRNKVAKYQGEVEQEYVDNSANDSATKDIVKSVETEMVEEADDPNGWYHLIEVDIEELQSINPDVIGWIYFENEESISYPLLYSGDDSEYLRKTYTGEEVKAGSIFVEGANNPDFNDAHTLIYGHNMRDLSMFGKLKFYKSEPDYYENHRYFQIITKDKVYRYQIFAYEDNSQLTGGVYRVIYEPLDDFYDFLEEAICNHSQVSCDINVRDYEHVVTLSTCSAAGSDYRFSVSAVRVEEHNRIPGYEKEED